MNKQTIGILRAFAEGYIGCAQRYEGIDDEWEDYLGYCLNFYDNGDTVIVAVYPIITTADGFKKEDMNNCLIENLLTVEV